MRSKSLLTLVGGSLVFSGVLHAQLWSGILDPSRAIDWSKAGVSGGIPIRTTVCATLGPGATLSQINSAISSCPSGQVVYLSSGSYTVSGSIVPKSGVTLRGAGMGVTKITSVTGFSGDGIITSAPSYDWYLTYSTSYDLVSPTRLATTITTTVNHNWSVGDYIHIDQLEDTTGPTLIQNLGSQGPNNSGSCRNPSAACRPLGQTVRIVSIPAANQAVIDTPLYWTYNKSPQATKETGFITGFGVEDLTIDNSAIIASKVIHMGGWHESWVLRVEVSGVMSRGSATFMYGSVHDMVRSCYFHGGDQGDEYTNLLYNRATANLFEDNIVVGLGGMFLEDGAVAGNVFGYNYATAMVYGGVWAGTGIGSHAAHPFYNLYEGNQMDTRFRYDWTFGTNSHQTMFRNAVKNEPLTTYVNGHNLVDLWYHAASENVIGNVLGTVGQETIYAETTGPINQTSQVVYAFGEETIAGDRGLDGGAALNSVFRQGNWDSVNNAVRWDEDIVNSNHTLPVSFYLSSKPNFFGSCAWPPIGPDLSPMTNDIPAKRTYNGNPCGTAARPNPPTLLTSTVH
jgi:hypothetical protein